MKACVVKVKYVADYDEAKKPVVTIQVISEKHLSHARLRLFFCFGCLLRAFARSEPQISKKVKKCARIGNLITRR